MEERVFTINIRKKGLTTARWKKTNKASSTIRNHIKRHMKIDDIKIGDSINREIWARGNEKPPSKIKIKAIKTKVDDNDIAKAEMWGHVFEEEVKEGPKEKKAEEKKIKEKPEESPKEEVVKEEKTEEKKKEPTKEQPKPKSEKIKEKDVSSDK